MLGGGLRGKGMRRLLPTEVNYVPRPIVILVLVLTLEVCA